MVNLKTLPPEAQVFYICVTISQQLPSEIRSAFESAQQSTVFE
jgi:hypothetical protein